MLENEVLMQKFITKFASDVCVFNHASDGKISLTFCIWFPSESHD